MVLAVVKRKAKEYETKDGDTPFKNWLIGLADARAKAKITKAITQMESGNFGDHKSITDGNGLYERRLNYGPGYRIYYITEGDKLIIIFAGSDKSDQQNAIDSAKIYHADFKARKSKVAAESTLKSGKLKKKR
jgi:putative addiction module killer protein